MKVSLALLAIVAPLVAAVEMYVAETVVHGEGRHCGLTLWYDLKLAKVQGNTSSTAKTLQRLTCNAFYSGAVGNPQLREILVGTSPKGFGIVKERRGVLGGWSDIEYIWKRATFMTLSHINGSHYLAQGGDIYADVVVIDTADGSKRKLISYPEHADGLFQDIRIHLASRRLAVVTQLQDSQYYAEYSFGANFDNVQLIGKFQFNATGGKFANVKSLLPPTTPTGPFRCLGVDEGDVRRGYFSCTLDGRTKSFKRLKEHAPPAIPNPSENNLYFEPLQRRDANTWASTGDTEYLYVYDDATLDIASVQQINVEGDAAMQFAFL